MTPFFAYGLMASGAAVASRWCHLSRGIGAGMIVAGAIVLATPAWADEHVLATPDHELAAVMGWSDAHVGDPAEDFAVLSTSASPDVLSTVRASYDRRTGRTDERLLERARLVAEMADLPALVEAHARGDRDALADIQSDLSHRSRLLAEAEELDAWE